MNLRKWWVFAFNGIGAAIDRWQARQLDQEIWDQLHLPMLRDSLGRCAICARPRAVDTELCPGPHKPWKATRKETLLCEESFHHEEFAGGFVCGCEICDASRLRHGGFKP